MPLYAWKCHCGYTTEENVPAAKRDAPRFHTDCVEPTGPTGSPMKRTFTSAPGIKFHWRRKPGRNPT